MRILLALTLLVAGCAGVPAPPAPAPSGAALPDVLGTWTGTWGGTPLTLVITEQKELGAYSGLYFGPVQLLGQRAPGLTGVMTSTIAGQPVSASLQGWLGATGQRVSLVLYARTVHGIQQLALTGVEAGRLTGRGDSDFQWGPHGEVELRRP